MSYRAVRVALLLAVGSAAGQVADEASREAGALLRGLAEGEAVVAGHAQGGVRADLAPVSAPVAPVVRRGVEADSAVGRARARGRIALVRIGVRGGQSISLAESPRAGTVLKRARALSGGEGYWFGVGMLRWW